MAEAAGLIGLAAAIAQFVEYASRLAARLDDFSAATGGFASLKARLVAVSAVVERIQKQAKIGTLSLTACEPLVNLISSTAQDVQGLLALIDKVLPAAKDKAMARYIKAARSLSSDKEIQRLSARLHENIQIISLFQTTALVDLGLGDSDVPPSDGSLLACRNTAIVSDSQSIVKQSPTLPGQSTVDTPSDSGVQTPSATDSEDDEPHETTGRSKGSQITSTQSTQSSIEACPASCSCVCHRPFQLASPAMLATLVGRLSIVYGGKRILSLPCTERKCRRSEQVSAQLTYRLPSWVLPLVLHTTLKSTALNTHINLNTLRILPDSAEVFSVLSRGDLDKLREMFNSNRASIHDVSKSNWTLLHTAYTLGHMHMASYLLQQGADPAIAADNGSNVVERAWFHAQKSAASPGDYVLSNNDVLRTIDLDDFMSQQQYTIVHKIVLGLSKLPLEDVLASSTAEIDKKDVRGGTPLWWASAQGNLAAIRTLLKHGGDPTIGGPMNQVPLHVARDAPTIRLLYEHGAQMDALDGLDRTPLHCFCYRQVGASAAIVRAALRCGAEVNATARGGQTPLHYAVMFGNVALTTPLLEAGADLEATMRGGLTPLAAAVNYDQAEVVQALLASKSFVEYERLQQHSILELAAARAGVSCMDALVSNLNKDRPSLELSLDPARSLWKAYEGRALRWDGLDTAFGKLLGAVGVDLHLLFQHDSHNGAHRCSPDSGCFGCLPMPGAFCG